MRIHFLYPSDMRTWIFLKPLLFDYKLLGLTHYSCFERAPHAGLSTLMSANEPFMPVNAACLKHARGNGRPYCVLKHAVESKHSTGVRSCNAYSMDTPLYWHYPQRAKHAITDNSHSLLWKTIKAHCGIACTENWWSLMALAAIHVEKTARGAR